MLLNRKTVSRALPPVRRDAGAAVGVWSVEVWSVNPYLSMRSSEMPEPFQCLRSASIPEYRSVYSEDLHCFPLAAAAASGWAARPARAAGLHATMSVSKRMQLEQRQHETLLLLEAAHKGMGVPPYHPVSA